MPVCSLCSTPETDDEKEGWIIGKRVGYCDTCREENKPEANKFESEAGRSRFSQCILNYQVNKLYPPRNDD